MKMFSRLIRLGTGSVALLFLSATASVALTIGPVSLAIDSTSNSDLPSPVIDNAPTYFTGTFDHVTAPPTLSSPGVYRSPFEDANTTVIPAGYVNTPFYSVRSGSATYNFGSAATTLSFLWGSPDPYNSLSFYSGADGTGLLATFTGNLLAGYAAHPDGKGHDFVSFLSSTPFLSIVLTSGQPAFEYASLMARGPDGEVPTVPVPPALILFASALVGLTALGRRRRKAAAI
jgi:hypothetical protein